MDVPVDEHYIEQLRQIPDFNRAYDVDGMTVEEFETFGPTAKTFASSSTPMPILTRWSAN